MSSQGILLFLSLIFLILIQIFAQNFYRIPLPMETQYNGLLAYKINASEFVVIESAALPVNCQNPSLYEYCVPKCLKPLNNFNYPGCLRDYLKKMKVID